MWRAVCFLGCALGAVVVLASAAEARQKGEAVSGDAIGGQVLNLSSSGQMVARAQNRSSQVALASHRTDERSAHAVAGQTGDLAAGGGSARRISLDDVVTGVRTRTDVVAVPKARAPRSVPSREASCATAIARGQTVSAYRMSLGCAADGRPVPIRDFAIDAPAGRTWTGFWVDPATGRCLVTSRTIRCSHATTTRVVVVLYGMLPPGTPIGFSANGGAFAWTARAP